jgi:hypothetical protein
MEPQLPEWLIAFSPDGREFIVRLKSPRFFVEAKQTDYRKWKSSVGGFDQEAEKLDDKDFEDLLKRACQFYISEIYGLPQS